MLSRKRNPFDRNWDEKPLIKMLVHLDSFVDELLTKETMITSLLELSKFPFLQIVAMPTQDLRIIELFGQKGLEISTYKEYKDFIALETKEFQKTVLMGKYDDLEIPIVDNSAINRCDFLVGRDEDFDYFVTNSKDPYFVCNLKKDRDISHEYALDLIRILLVNLGYFYLLPNYSINEGFYYLYRFKKLFYEYQFPWSVIVATHGKSTSENVFNQFDSLSMRLELICRAADKTCFFALKSPNNDTQDNTLYHFGYLIMLITGVFDDLAWIINGLYNFNLEKRDVVIKVPPHKKSTKFYDLLKSVNQNLHDYLTSEDTQNKIIMLYPIRDSLQHRQFIKGIRYKSQSEGYDKNLFRIPTEAARTLKTISVNDGMEYGLVFSLEEKFYIEAHTFTLKCVKLIAEIVNNSIRLINWEHYMEVLSDKEKKELYDSKNQFKEGLGKFLGWSNEPLYF
jgi:hypothetical protein